MKTKNQINILFLALELSGYFIACLEALNKKEGVKLAVIRLRVNEEAPFAFSVNEEIELIRRDSFKNENELLSYSKAFQPNLVYTAGWGDKAYLSVSKYLKRKNIPVVMGIDNPWSGSLKQKIARLVFPFTYKKCFSHAWAAGESQVEYAKKLGFPKDKIMKGVYSADIDKFLIQNEKIDRTNTILYVGRFLDWKGVHELYEAFLEINPEKRKNWKLRMIGNGPLKSEFKTTDSILIEDFVQPDELVEIMQSVKVFCLASWTEHWGVVVHEAAAAGCVLLISDGVESAKEFLIEKQNGFSFKAKSKESIKSAIEKIIECDESQFEKMSIASVKRSKSITPEIWASTFLNVLKTEVRV